MTPRKALLLLAVLAFGVLVAGCGDSEIGSAPVVKVSPEQRAKDLNATAESTVTWLEGIDPDKRQAAIERSPQITATLKEASDPALKQRIAALGIKLL
jgi:hypothetical protein